MQHFHSIIFEDLNSSSGIPSPPLALFIVMLCKAHLTSHSRMSGSRWVITSWLAGSWRSFFVQFFCAFLSPLLNIFYFCYVHIISVLYWAHLCMKYSLGISNFLEEISSLSHSIVFLYFFSLISEEGFLISPYYSLELCIQIGISFLFYTWPVLLYTKIFHYNNLVKFFVQYSFSFISNIKLNYLQINNVYN